MKKIFKLLFEINESLKLIAERLKPMRNDNIQ